MRKMMIAFAILSHVTAIAQDVEQAPLHTTKYFVKGYLTGYLSSYTNSLALNNRQLNTSIGDYVQPTFAVGFYNKRGNYHEVELSTIRAKKTDITEFIETSPNTFEPRTGYIINRTELAMRYEYVKVFFKNKKTCVQPSIGIAGMPYYSRYVSTPRSTAYFPVKQTSLGVRAFIVPRLAIPLSQRVMLDVNIPICLIEGGVTQKQIGNPNIPAHAQDNNIIDLMTLPDYHTARLGLMVKL